MLMTMTLNMPSAKIDIFDLCHLLPIENRLDEMHKSNARILICMHVCSICNISWKHHICNVNKKSNKIANWFVTYLVCLNSPCVYPSFEDWLVHLVVSRYGVSNQYMGRLKGNVCSYLHWLIIKRCHNTHFVNKIRSDPFLIWEKGHLYLLSSIGGRYRSIDG